MTQSEVVLVFTETVRGWNRRKGNERGNALVQRLVQAGQAVFHNDYTLAFHNLHHPVVLFGGAKFLKAWSLPNPIIALPQISTPGEIDFLCHDLRIRHFFLPAQQIDFLRDERVLVGAVDHPDLPKKMMAVLHGERLTYPTVASD